MRLPATELQPGDIVHNYGINYRVVEIDPRSCPGLTADPDRVYMVCGNHMYSVSKSDEVAVIERHDGTAGW